MKFLALALVFCIATASQAQECHVGVYTEPAGLNSFGHMTPFDEGAVHIYVVARVENFVNAVAYRLEITSLNEHILLLGRFFGPEGTGLNITTPGGDNVGLGECAVGFGQTPILVEEFVLYEPPPAVLDRMWVRMHPNPDSGATVVYSSCQSEILLCTTSDLLLVRPLPTESKSWGQIKSLY